MCIYRRIDYNRCSAIGTSSTNGSQYGSTNVRYPNGNNHI